MYSVTDGWWNVIEYIYVSIRNKLVQDLCLLLLLILALNFQFSSIQTGFIGMEVWKNNNIAKTFCPNIWTLIIT